MKTKATLIIIGIIFVMSGCAISDAAEKNGSIATKTQKQIHYEENDTPLTYDELMLWANDMTSRMSSVQALSSSESSGGTVLRDYGYAKILWSAKTAPKMLELDMTKPDLACPRGVFLGNPLKKVIAYYKVPENPDLKKKQLFYYEEKNSENVCRIAYGFCKDSEIIFGAVKKSGGRYEDARLIFGVKNEKVTRISYLYKENADATGTEEYIKSIKQ